MKTLPSLLISIVSAALIWVIITMSVYKKPYVPVEEPESETPDQKKDRINKMIGVLLGGMFAAGLVGMTVYTFIADSTPVTEMEDERFAYSPNSWRRYETNA